MQILEVSSTFCRPAVLALVACATRPGELHLSPRQDVMDVEELVGKVCSLALISLAFCASLSNTTDTGIFFIVHRRELPA